MSASEATPLFGGRGSGDTAPSRGRRPTDPSFLLFVLAPCVGAMFFVAASARYSGNLQRLVHGTDFAGNICGVDGPVRSRPYLYWPFELPDGDRTMALCLEYCPVREERVFLYSAATGDQDSGYFLSHAAAPVRKTCFPSPDEAKKLSAAGRGEMAAVRARQSVMQALGDVGEASGALFLICLLAPAVAATCIIALYAAPYPTIVALGGGAVALTAPILLVSGHAAAKIRELNGADDPGAGITTTAAWFFVAGIAVAVAATAASLGKPRRAPAVAARFLRTARGALRGVLPGVAGPACVACAAVVALCVYWVNVALLLATSGTAGSKTVDPSKYQVSRVTQLSLNPHWLLLLAFHTFAVGYLCTLARAALFTITVRRTAMWFSGGADEPVVATCRDTLASHTGTVGLTALVSTVFSPLRLPSELCRRALPPGAASESTAGRACVGGVALTAEALQFADCSALNVTALRGAPFKDASLQARGLIQGTPGAEAGLRCAARLGPWAVRLGVSVATACCALCLCAWGDVYVYGTDWEPPLSSPAGPMLSAFAACYLLCGCALAPVEGVLEGLLFCTLAGEDEDGASRQKNAPHYAVAGEVNGLLAEVADWPVGAE